MALAIFDLDHTLLQGDSDYEWGRFLVRLGVVDGETYERTNLAFYEQYKAGTLDIHEFARFAFRPLAENPVAQLQAWRVQFMEEVILSMISAGSRDLLDTHRGRGDTLLIITATNRFVTEPIARELGVDHLLATDPEFHGGRYTGRIAGVPCFREGKVTRLQQWLEEHGRNLQDSWFYSDSHNDLPLLELVDHPVAVDADEPLTRIAGERGWRTLSLVG
ncbi:MAG: HAD-IB family hydrolase [Gammaproteobacteria bacterium]